MVARRAVVREVAGAAALVALTALIGGCASPPRQAVRAAAPPSSAAATTTTRAPVEAEAPPATTAPPPSPAAPPPAPTTATTTPRPLVVVIGESLVVQTRDLLAQRLAAAGNHAIVFGLDSQQIDSTWTREKIAWAVGQHAAAVVLASSANDGVALFDRAQQEGWPAATSAYQAEVEAALGEVGPRCTVLVDTRDSPMAAWYHLDKSGPPVNRVIAQAAAAHPGVHDVTWSDLSRPHLGDWFWRDGLHFGDPDHGNADWHPAGAAAFVEAVAGGVAACAPAQ